MIHFFFKINFAPSHVSDGVAASLFGCLRVVFYASCEVFESIISAQM